MAHSKEDEEILKAAYLVNPKPDKAARIEIVSRVALGEKECQIWFQNKRQNDRKRSRPADASLMSSSSSMSDPVTEEEVDAHESENTEDQSAQDEVAKPETPEPVVETEPSPDPSADDAVVDPRTLEGAELEDAKSSEPTKTDSDATTESLTVVSTDPLTTDAVPSDISSSQSTLPSSQGASQPRTSWISNRRSASFKQYNDDYVPETTGFLSPVLPPHEPSARSLKRVHSFVRITTNEDGTARVVTDLDKTPSPPHAKTSASTFARAAAGLRRSYSLNERLEAVARGEPSPKVPRTSLNMGRSRDSRAWEFWCDQDSRYNTSLTTRAEQEGSGSAADAIGLLRASRSILAQNQSRQNTPIISRQTPSKAQGTHGVKKSRGPMQRATTSFGRLQSKAAHKTPEGSESDELPQTESDKENWEPEIPKSQRGRQVATPPASQRARKILGENTDFMSQSSSLGAMLAKEKNKSAKRKATDENADPEQDDELGMFMGGGGTGVSSAEEAGCVEGLLKLSQGNWR
ncbi:hypothetical protein BDV95DRAFT_624054 [Massariosphaeria phaeospora]|uniref:Homeobox domain-containing protein n=1 Tax=Massariosphaeria phaeospora TaxID=100035 RepID=A0A7C8MB93_9PLEO|nr:hypothetical protein BDV95DRAFT_624054 [Massariosphaeria phaeospora]